MTTSPILRNISAAFLLAACVCQAQALDNNKQLLSGGNYQVEGATAGGTATSYTAPGMARQYDADTIPPGLGPSIAALRLPEAGVLSKLRVHVVTVSAPATGTFTLTVLKNGAPTSLKCSVSTSSDCSKNTAVSFSAGDRLSIEVKNTFANSGNVAYTYTMLLD